MTPLGKPLVFHLKYFAEVARFFDDQEDEGEAPDLTGLEDAEHIRKMARTVGVAADEQAADFLELCGKVIEDHFTSIGATIVKKMKRTILLRDWCWYAPVGIPSVSGGQFSCGLWLTSLTNVRITLEKDVCGLVVPYIWLQGGRKGADAVWKILDGWPHSRAGGGVVDDRGQVALACIPIKVQPPESFEVDREPLLAEVTKTIARIGGEQTKAIASFVAGLKKSDEA